VFVCRKAFGRTRKRSPRICSSIASSPQTSRDGTLVISAGVSFTAQWMERTSGNSCRAAAKLSSSNSPGAVTRTTSA
jgi:hypothetical protein